MARITESVPTPIASEMQQTIFQIHKSQADIDPITNKEFQWSALKGKVVGTFYDQAQAGAANQSAIGFGLDVDTFLRRIATRYMHRDQTTYHPSGYNHYWRTMGIWYANPTLLSLFQLTSPPQSKRR